MYVIPQNHTLKNDQNGKFCVIYILPHKNIFLFLNIYLFIYFWLCWVFVAACGLSLVAARGVYSSLRCVGFSLLWLLLLRSTGSSTQASVVVARGLSSCGSRA